MGNPKFILTLPPSKRDPEGNKQIETNSSIVIIGPNGSGKTRLGTWIELDSQQKKSVYRISAQKSLKFLDNIAPINIDIAKSSLLYGHESGDFSFKRSQRWHSQPNTFLLNDYDKLLIFLFSEEFEKSTKYRQEARDNFLKINEPPITFLDKVQRIWEEVLPHRKLKIGSGKVEVLDPISSNEYYKASEMSDGERIIFYLIGSCLSFPQDSIIVIDEPEMHLHKSLQSKLWDAIELERQDCLFVYLTHDLDFASSRMGASKVCVNSYNKNEWDWYLVPEIDAIPEEIYLKLIGGRKPIIFIEGDKNQSFDINIYKYLYPSFTISPLSGGCKDVIHATVSFNQFKDFHHLQCWGIIDRDFRTEEDVSQLKEKNIYVLDVAEIENLFLIEEVLKIIYTDLHKNNFIETFEQIKDIVLNELKTNINQITSAIITSSIEKNIIMGFDAKARGVEAIKQSLSKMHKSIDVEKLYITKYESIQKIITNRDYEKALKIYPHKGLLGKTSNILGFKSKGFKDHIFDFIKSDDGFKVIEVIRKYTPQIPLP